MENENLIDIISRHLSYFFSPHLTSAFGDSDFLSWLSDTIAFFLLFLEDPVEMCIICANIYKW